MIYLDNNATTKILPEVKTAVSETLSVFGNPSSRAYEYGRAAKRILDKSRSRVADFLECEPQEVIFTGGGSESIFMAIFGAALENKQYTNVLTSPVEHPAVRETLKLIESIFNFKLTEFQINREGEINIEAINQDRYALASIMLANNETGIINNISEILKTNSSIKFCHLDAVQALGKLPLSFSSLGVDSISLAGHKIHGPKGIGALILNKNALWKPFLTGGGQEMGRRGGTESIPLIVGLAEACGAAKKRLMEGSPGKIEQVRDHFEEILLNEVKEVKVIGQSGSRLSNTSACVVEGALGYEIVEEAGRAGICISSGSACKSDKIEPSNSLRGMGYSVAESMGLIRISFSFENTLEEAEAAAIKLAAIIKTQQGRRNKILENVINGKE